MSGKELIILTLKTIITSSYNFCSQDLNLTDPDMGSIRKISNMKHSDDFLWTVLPIPRPKKRKSLSKSVN